MYSIPREQACKLYDSEFWKAMPGRDRALFQLCIDEVCMPFSIFHMDIGNCINEPGITTYSIALLRDGLIRRIWGKDIPPTREEILGLIPEQFKHLLA